MHLSRNLAFTTALLLLVVVTRAWSAPFDEAFPDAQIETTEEDVRPTKEPARDDSAADVAADELRSIDQYQTAREALQAGDLQRCEQTLRTLYAERPNLPPHKLMLVRMLIEERQLRAARTVLENVAGAHLDHPELYLLFAKLAVADGRFTDAGLHLKEARALPQPKNWTPEQFRRFDLQCLAGETLVAEQHRDWDKAIGLYQRSIDADPQNAALRLRSAIALYRAGQLEAAYEQFDVAYRQDAEFHPPELALALLLVRDEKYRPAEAWFQKAIERYPREPRVYFQRSVALLGEDRAKEADAMAAKAAALGMETRELLVHRGDIAAHQRQFEHAEDFYRTALKQDPHDVEAATSLAIALAEQQSPAKTKEALQLLETAQNEQPNSAVVKVALGWAQFHSGQQEPAAATLAAAAKQMPSEPTTLFFQSVVLHALGRKDEALRVAQKLDQVVDRPGVFVYRPAARRWLAEILPPSP